MPGEHDGEDSLTQGSHGLAAALYGRTRELHLQAERTGFVREMLRGRAGRDGYVLYLRNLQPVYRALEQGLERHRSTPGLGPFAEPALYRSQALESDLVGLAGAGWHDALPILREGHHYAQCVEVAAAGAGVGLIGHAYTRYLGDLSGGQILSRLLAKSLSLGPETLRFYAFPAIPDVEAFKASYRDRLDDAEGSIDAVDSLLDEAALAFELNIDLSAAVQAAVEAA